MNREEQAEALALAKDLLDDIELDRTTVDKQVLKGARLARLVGDTEAESWLRQERLGFGTDADQNRYFFLTGRATAADEGKPLYVSASWIASAVSSLRGRLAASRVPDIASEYVLPALTQAHSQINSASNQLTRWEGILSRIGSALHLFVETTYHQLKFAKRQEAMFDRSKKVIDDKLRQLDPGTLSKIDSASSNLAAGDKEAIAGAMTSVRRLVDSFADAVFPPSDPRPHASGRGEVLLTAQHKVNRIRAFIDDHCESKSRKQRLGEGLDKIYARVSNGVHNDATKEEAEFLFLSTYILLGEVLSLASDGQRKGTDASEEKAGLTP